MPAGKTEAGHNPALSLYRPERAAPASMQIVAENVIVLNPPVDAESLGFL